MPNEHFTVEEFLALVEPAGDATDLELINGRIWYGGMPFYEFVVRYLATLNQEPRPRSDP